MKRGGRFLRLVAADTIGCRGGGRPGWAGEGLLSTAILLALGCASLAGCGTASSAPSSSAASTQSLPRAAGPSSVAAVTVSPGVVDFGTVAPGAQASREVTVRNGTAAEVAVAEIRSSCDCVTVAPRRFSILPGAERLLAVELDLRGEPSAAGALGVEVQAFGQDGAEVFRLEVALAIGEPVYSPLMGE